MAGSLVALTDARANAEALLGERFAQGVIDDDELDRRLDLVLEAIDSKAVHDAVEDLLEPGGALVPVGQPTTALAVDVRDHAKFSAFMGEQTQRGVWVPARVNDVKVRLGEGQFDLREARLAPGVTEFRLNVVLGEVEIIVPPGMRVDVDTRVFLGSVNHDEPSAHDPGAPHVRITGRVVLGEVNIREREPGESKRQARKRRRRARKLARARRKALPSAD